MPILVTSTKVTTAPASWHNWWLARFIRWVAKKRLLYRKPLKWLKLWRRLGWLSELAFANAVEVTYERDELPKDALECARAMINYLTYRGDKPDRILVGPKALHDLEESFVSGYSEFLTPYMLDRRGRCEIFGIPIQVNPFLAEDAIIVC
jgi:hypothetical protein